MVSFWPWSHDDASPASFEKTLSTLSAKITATQTQLEKARTGARRTRVLGTLYLGFAYLVYAIVLLLVVGWRNMGPAEWTGLAGSPVLIYLVRAATIAFYNLRIDGLATRLKDQQEERARTIQKLKDATRYDSTLQLLEKYGGSENKPPRNKGGRKKAAADESGGGDDAAGEGRGKNNNNRDGEEGQETSHQEHRAPNQQPRRTNLPPPPTANIQRPISRAGTPQQVKPPQQSPEMDMDFSAEFAPNAFGPGPGPGPGPGFAPAPPSAAYPPYAPVPQAAALPETHWYDRIIDTLLGEDETAPKNRIALICRNCRLVNGQAPPGVRSLAELGTWRCMACGAMNGEEDEGERIVRDVLREHEERAAKDDARKRGGNSGRGGTPSDEDGGESGDLVLTMKREEDGSRMRENTSTESEQLSKHRKREE